MINRSDQNLLLLSRVIAPVMIAIGMITAFSFFSSGYSLIVTFVPGVIAAVAFYFLAFYRKKVDSERLLIYYLIGLAIQFLHFMEEYVTDFNEQFPKLFNSPAYGLDLFVIFNMCAYSAFVLGAIVLYKQIRPLLVIPLFFIMYGIVGNALAHTIFCVVVKGYFPGIYSAVAYWFLGPLILKEIWKTTRSSS